MTFLSLAALLLAGTNIQFEPFIAGITTGAVIGLAGYLSRTFLSLLSVLGAVALGYVTYATGGVDGLIAVMRGLLEGVLERKHFSLGVLAGIVAAVTAARTLTVSRHRKSRAS